MGMSFHCVPCSAGYFAHEVGSGACSLCIGGTFSEADSSFCGLCRVGEHSGPGSGWCLPCPAGRYSSMGGSSECSRCSAGHTSAEGSGNCSACAAGRYALGVDGSCPLCFPGRSSAAGLGGVGSPPQPYWFECNLGLTLDGSASGRVYDGHGAISVGATSRLLFDYPEPYRGQILDYLFLPKLGASLHMLKVEIGGDSQTGFGTEPSHKHHRSDLSCSRGYEFWLIREARRRNPELHVYALAASVPAWVGGPLGTTGGFYSQDLVDYLVQYLQCALQIGAGVIQYLGNRNERSWGPPAWIIELRRSLDSAGFHNTRLILPDGAYDEAIIKHVLSDRDFARSMQDGGIGVHHPCYLPRHEVQAAGLKYWASEDQGVRGDWDGAGCWGRTLNQNFVRMNMTSTIARSLVWSVYDGVSDNSDGFIDAVEPWSGNYVVRSPIWITAHTTQFVQVGWLILDTLSGSSGYLRYGGSFVTFIPPERDGRFVLVVEKLHGACRACETEASQMESLTVSLTGGLDAAVESATGFDIGLWMTNRSHNFMRLPDLVVENGTFPSFTFTAMPDSIYTIVGLPSGQHHHDHRANPIMPVPQSANFPSFVEDDFDGYTIDASPKFFADFGGSWQVAADPSGMTSGDNLVLKQWASDPGGSNAWLHGVEPITLFGDQFTDAVMSVDVYIPAHHAQHDNAGDEPLPALQMQSSSSGLCMTMLGKFGSSGSYVGVQDCTKDKSGRLWFDDHTGLLHDDAREKCVAAGHQCSSLLEGQGICMVECGGSQTNSSTLENTWSWRAADGTLRLQASPELCLTVSSELFAGRLAVHLLPCGQRIGNSLGANLRQRWMTRKAAPQIYAGLCLRLTPPKGLRSRGKLWHRPGHCLSIGVTEAGEGIWQLDRDGEVLAAGDLSSPSGTWHSLMLEAVGPVLRTRVDEYAAEVVDETRPQGMAALTSGWNEAFFDNFASQIVQR